MNKNNDLFCKIFVDTDKNMADIVGLVFNIVGGSKDKWIIISEHAEFDIRKNEDFNESKRVEIPDGFLYSRYYLDVEPKENASQDDYISDIAELLTGLWNSGCKAVAASDFEDELPRKGGYK